jgi:protein TonB
MGGSPRTGEKNATALKAPIITRLSFNQSSPDTVPEEPVPIKRQQPKPLKKIKPEPVRVKPAEKKPVAAEPVLRKKEAVEKKDPARQTAVQEQIKGERISHSPEGLLQKERQLYLHELMSHIESFKYYPRAARKRYLQGDVKVSFMLLDDGYYRQLKLDGKHSVLVKATRSAMEMAVPFPLPPEGIKLPARFEFTMSYSLTD